VYTRTFSGAGKVLDGAEKMIVVVDKRAEVCEVYKSTLSREGVVAVTFEPEDFIGWFQSCEELDLSAVEGILLGEFDARELFTRTIKKKMEVPAIALNDFNTLDATLKLYMAGMDDVVRKPIHAKELIARIDAIRRRSTVSRSSLWSQDGLVVYGDGREPEVNGEVIRMPRRERRILQYLAANRGRRVTRAQIFSAIYGFHDENVEECVVESHISKLRKKLRNELGYDPIDTQRFLGYQLVGRELVAA
jgi:two-component system, OmpR family, flagellar system response regulator FtcR